MSKSAQPEEPTTQTAASLHSYRADAVLALIALIWGTTFVVVKQAVSEISPNLFLALRFSLATACMLMLFLPAFLRMERRELISSVRCGFIAGMFLWLGYVLQTFGLKYTTAGKSGFLTGLYIVLVPVISAIAYRQMPALREWGGLALAAMGMVLMTIPDPSTRASLNRGDILTIGCAVAFAFHLLVLGRYSKRERVEGVAFGQVACAAILSTGSLVMEKPVMVWSRIVVFSIVLTAVFATAAAFALQTWAQKRTSATRTALIFALEPVFALVAAILAGEPANWMALGGGALILSGIVAVELG